MRSASIVALGLLALLGTGCASVVTQRPQLRDATGEERASVARLLVPLLITADMWKGPAAGCTAALGILPVEAINLGVGPNSKCTFSLVITEEALKVLPPDELRAALAHELGHVKLGHFAARRERRAAERKTRDEISAKGTTAGAAATAIPIIGPLLAIGVAGTQMAADTSVEEHYRAYDREEEMAADRFGLDLLQLVIGRARACEAEVALLERLAQARRSRPWASWLSTHPQPVERLKVARELCPG
jgi:Zn-dependent protease with chaperone function